MSALSMRSLRFGILDAGMIEKLAVVNVQHGGTMNGTPERVLPSVRVAPADGSLSDPRMGAMPGRSGPCLTCQQQHHDRMPFFCKLKMQADATARGTSGPGCAKNDIFASPGATTHRTAASGGKSTVRCAHYRGVADRLRPLLSPAFLSVLRGGDASRARSTDPTPEGHRNALCAPTVVPFFFS